MTSLARRYHLHAILALPVLVLLLMACSLVALGQETVPPVVESKLGLAAVLLSLPGRLVGAALVVALVEWMKQWRDRTVPPVEGSSWGKRAAYALLVSPLGRMWIALMLALPAAAAAWAAGAALDDVGTLVLSGWLGAMGMNAGLGVVANPRAKDLPPPVSP